MKKSPKKRSAAIVPVRIDDVLLERIQAVATRLGEPQSTVMRMCMRIGLSAVEELAEKNAGQLVASLLAPDQAPEAKSTEGKKSKAA